MRIRLLSTVLLALSSLCAAVYNDPQGRFSLQAPAGWKTTPLNADSVQVASGSGYVTALAFAGSDARTLVDSVARQLGAQWTGFTQARTGDMRLAGRSGVYATYSGTNPKGVPAYLQLLATAEGNNTFLLVISAPKTEFAKFKPGFDQIEKSFTVNAARATSPSAQAERPSVASSYQARQASMDRLAQQRREALEPASKGKAAPPGAPPARARPAQVAGSPTFYRMKKAAVIDQHGFERPMPALTLLIPNDWQFRGMFSSPRRQAARSTW